MAKARRTSENSNLLSRDRACGHPAAEATVPVVLVAAPAGEGHDKVAEAAAVARVHKLPRSAEALPLPAWRCATATGQCSSGLV